MSEVYEKARKMAERSRQAREKYECDHKDRMNRFVKRITRKDGAYGKTRSIRKQGKG